MLEFLTDVAVFTVGIICLIFWIIVIAVGLIEFYDMITGADKKAKKIEDLLKEED